MKKIIGLVITALLTACGGSGVKTEVSSSVAATPKVIDTSFYQHWVHSHEEQNGQKTPNIFRPNGSREFAPSRFRMQFGFDKSGQCNYMFLSPTDAHEMRDCVYTKIGNKVYLYDNAGGALNHLAFTIESVNSDEMKMSYGVVADVVAAPLKNAVKKKNVQPQ